MSFHRITAHRKKLGRSMKNLVTSHPVADEISDNAVESDQRFQYYHIDKVVNLSSVSGKYHNLVNCIWYEAGYEVSVTFSLRHKSILVRC